MRNLLATASAFVLLTSLAAAQEGPVGKYTGSFTSNQAAQISIILDIKSVENGVVVGQGSRYGRTQHGVALQNCVGEFPLTGSLKGNELDVRAAEKSGQTKDCQFRLRGTVSGSKILGKMGPYEIELSR